jgi:hypothetical protein
MLKEAADVLATLARLGSDPMSGVYLQPPADEATIWQMQEAARRDLGEPVPEEYAALLRVANGVQINGAYFKSAENLVPENLDVLRREIIVLGTEGNMAELVFDLRDRQFHTINMGFPDERFESFGSFAELLAVVLQEQQVL